MKGSAHKMGPDSPHRESPNMYGHPGMHYGSSSAAGTPGINYGSSSAHGLQVPGPGVLFLRFQL